MGGKAVQDDNGSWRSQHREWKLLPSSRGHSDVSETQYQLGVAQGFNKQYDEAVKSLKLAIQILKERVQNIKNEEKSSEVEKKEAEELEALIPEIEGKIADTEDMKKSLPRWKRKKLKNWRL